MQVGKEIMQKISMFLSGRQPMLCAVEYSSGCVLCSGGCIGCDGSCEGCTGTCSGSCEQNCTAYQANVPSGGNGGDSGGDGW